MFLKFIYIILAIFFVWQLYGYLKTHPEALSKININKSLFTLGILALILIGFVAMLVLLVRK